jgi:RND family efflux transporter MFP subunit
MHRNHDAGDAMRHDGTGGRNTAGTSSPPRTAIAAVLLGGLMTAACGGGPTAARPEGARPVAAKVAAAEESAWSRVLTVPADVAPLRRATPGTILMGRVDQIVRREGDRVKAGEVLARVESRDVSARLAQAEAGAAAATAMERNAQLMKERMERLVAKQAATQKNLEDATAGYDAAAANLEAAKEGVAAARMYVSYSRVTAPFDGVVVERRVEAGDTVAPGMPLFAVEDTSTMKIEAQVPEMAVRDLRVGDPLEIEVDAAGGGTRKATLSEILPSADPRSRTRAVRALLPNSDGSLRSGMFARMRLAGGEGRALAVPEAALVRRGPLTGVFVVDEQGIARLRWVTLGEARDGRTEVLTGLAKGERIVTEPPADLEDGRRVEAR